MLRPQGFFALFDIMQMKDGALQFPVPWAASAEGSFLATADAYRQALEQAGLTVIAERNRHAFPLEFFRRIAEASAMAKGPVPERDRHHQRRDRGPGGRQCAGQSGWMG